MNITIVGGDFRTVELAKILKENGNNIFTYGLEQCEEINNLEQIKTLQEINEKSKIIITSIPLSKNGETINTPFSNNNIGVKEFFNTIKNKKIITGNITEQIKSYINDENKIIDILKNEELTILNAIPTAEGAIQVAMEKSEITIHNSKCLVMGFGRIGKILAKMLQGIGANVYCEARKQSDLALIKMYGYTAIDLKELNNYLNEFDFIFNTIPYIILNESNLKLIKKECILIDLASKPGGIDFEIANKLNIKNEWLLALPGKVAPKTSAKYIYESIASEIISDNKYN